MERLPLCQESFLPFPVVSEFSETPPIEIHGTSEFSE
jgi:hypothetical protein